MPTVKLVRGDDPGGPSDHRPSEVFKMRLKELRQRRGLSQAELADAMTANGFPMNRQALIRIEAGDQTLPLDTALMFAAVLNVAPAHLLSPPDDEHVFVTATEGFDGAGMRSWLRFGDAMREVQTARNQADKQADSLGRRLEVYARALVDARAGRDDAGAVEALKAIVDAVRSASEEEISDAS